MCFFVRHSPAAEVLFAIVSLTFFRVVTDSILPVVTLLGKR